MTDEVTRRNVLEDDVIQFLARRVKDILMHSALDSKREWTVQGFGMMRTYLDDAKTWRLNIYHPDLAVPNVSVHHNHPWSFTSWILGGKLTNTKYHRPRKTPALLDLNYDVNMHGARIMTGIKSNVGEAGGGGVKPEFTTWLVGIGAFEYNPGDWYMMHHAEIHKTDYTPGCVTLNRRIVEEGTGEHADVFWRYGTDWVSAKPRIATANEIAWLTKLGQEQVEEGGL